ncbi:MAG: hypothetical protein H6Q14_764 [Bacteroidetes bacterium]|jgi:hypothetical protein|nr:hypothetical protein [Bacteroidota bacterium]
MLDSIDLLFVRYFLFGKLFSTLERKSFHFCLAGLLTYSTSYGLPFR